MVCGLIPLLRMKGLPDGSGISMPRRNGKFQATLIANMFPSCVRGTRLKIVSIALSQNKARAAMLLSILPRITSCYHTLPLTPQGSR